MQGQRARPSPLNLARSLQLTSAIAVARLSRDSSRLLHRGAGTTIPGVLGRRVAPSGLRDLTASFPMGTVLVAGTNGKTTTARLLASMLRADHKVPIHNQAGANMLSGVTGAVLTNASMLGKARGDIGLFETDEASLVAILREVRPRAALVLNVFRDQLDRYGEIDQLTAAWVRGIRDSGWTGTLVLNADDPGLVPLSEDAGVPVMWFGACASASVSDGSLAADSTHCRCGQPLAYAHILYGHVGQWHCDACGRKRADPQVEATQVRLDAARSSAFTLRLPSQLLQIEFPLPGLYNVENAAAASALAVLLGLPSAAIQAGLQGASPAFGRSEIIQTPSGPIALWLVKNPTGFNQALHTALRGPEPHAVMIAVNDRPADGQDVSWLWDTDFEALATRLTAIRSLVCSGSRAYDMALRLKYAGVPTDRIAVRLDLEEAFALVLAEARPGGTVSAFTTYTALLELRDKLVRRGWAQRMWDL